MPLMVSVMVVFKILIISADRHVNGFAMRVFEIPFDARAWLDSMSTDAADRHPVVGIVQVVSERVIALMHGTRDVCG